MMRRPEAPQRQAGNQDISDDKGKKHHHIYNTCICGHVDDSITFDSSGGEFASREAAVVSQFNTINFTESEEKAINEVNEARQGENREVLAAQGQVSSMKADLESLNQALKKQNINIGYIGELQRMFDEKVTACLKVEEEKLMKKEAEIIKAGRKLDEIEANQKKIFRGFVAGVVIVLALLTGVVYFIVRAVAL